MLLAAAALGVLSIAGLVTPWLLALIFAVGTGHALTSPTWQTLQPELVPPEERPQAISLGAVNQNLARAVGPAIGGIILAATGAGTVFLINAAVRAGARYVSASPALHVILLLAGVFVFLASSIWALLPVTAESQPHLGWGGYGLLLGCVGVGAVVGALLLPALRKRLGPGTQLAAGSIALACVALILGYVHITALVAVSLAVAGMAWILALSTLNSLYQLTLPQWIRARGLSFYLIVFQGGNAVGSAVLGITAEHLGLSPTLLITAAGLALGPLIGLRYRFQLLPFLAR